MKYKFFLVFVFCPLLIKGQNTFQDVYNEFRQQAKSEYEDFRKKANQEYADKIKKIEKGD